MTNLFATTTSSTTKSFASIVASAAAAVGLMFVAGCTAADIGEDVGEATGSTEQGKIIGANDLTPVIEDGANVPVKYAALIDAFGIMSMGCTGTHIGNGIVLSAGHCFNAPSTRTDNASCAGKNIHWGVRKDSPAYLTSTCSTILSYELNNKRDYAIFKVSPVPPTKVDVDFVARPALDTALTIFSHPRRRPLEWSKSCVLKAGSAGNWGLDQFSHQCDTEPGSSGATILNDVTLKVVGIHDGGTTAWNYGTYLANTPLKEILAAQEPAADPVVVTPNATN